MYIDLIQNTSLLVALTTLYSLLSRLNGYGETWGKILSGLLFGGVAMVGMQLPFHYAPGVIYDGRSIILAMAGLFGGGTAAVVSTILSGAYRAHMGGAGIWAGLGTIIGCAAVGLAFRRGYGNRPDRMSILSLYGFGISVHVVMLACQLLIQPWPFGLAVINRIWLPILFIFPIVTVVMGLFLGTEEHRIQAERSLRDSEEKYRGVVENANECIIVTQDGILKFVNRKTLEVSGYSEAEMVAMPFLDFVHQDDRLAVMQHHMKRLKGEEIPEVYVLRIIAKDGAIRWLENNGIIITWEGKPATFNLLTDITERNRSEAEIRESEEHFRVIFERSTVGKSLMGPDGKLLRINQAFADMLGYEIEEVLQLDLAQITHPDDMAKNRECIRALMAGEQAGYRFEKRYIHKNGDIVWTDVGTTLLRNEQGTPRYFVTSIIDITGRKQADEEKMKLQAQFLQAQKMESVGRLAGGVAHDFNNMLGIILGYAELALGQVEPAKPLHANLLEIRDAANRSADLTRQLLAFARKQTISPKVLDLNDTIESMLKMLRRLIGENIDLSWLPGEGLWPVNMDPSQIDQILANLCINARDAIDGEGKVLISTGNVTLDEIYCANNPGSVPGEYMALSVCDDGCGMDSETRDRIFEPFFTTKEMGKGTGLGLATVYGIVKQNNGFINVYSEPGMGTTFKIYLNRHMGKAGQLRQEVSAEPVTRGTETILLVEDDPSILDMTTMMLEHLGYTVLAASTPDEAIRLTEAHPEEAHLLMTDVVMPRMNGRDLAGKLQSLSPNLKILFMSGYTADVIADNGVIDPGVHFIQKPFSMRDLAAKVRKVLENTDA